MESSIAMSQTHSRQVTGTGKDDDLDITSLCGSGFHVDKATAIDETIAAGNGADGAATPYFVEIRGATVRIRVYRRTMGESEVFYLRTDADHTASNNLDALPDC